MAVGQRRSGRRRWRQGRHGGRRNDRDLRRCRGSGRRRHDRGRRWHRCRRRVGGLRWRSGRCSRHGWRRWRRGYWRGCRLRCRWRAGDILLLGLTALRFGGFWFVGLGLAWRGHLAARTLPPPQDLIGHERQHGNHRQDKEGAPQARTALGIDLGVAAKKWRPGGTARPAGQQSSPEQQGAKQAERAQRQEHHRPQCGRTTQHTDDPAPSEIPAAHEQIGANQTSQGSRQQGKRKQPLSQPVHRAPSLPPAPPAPHRESCPVARFRTQAAGA